MRDSRALRLVLDVLLAAADPIWGYEILTTTKLKSGTVYPLMDRLLAAGWVTETREAVNAVHPGRPPRCLYRLTATGATEAREHLARAIPPGAAWI